MAGSDSYIGMPQGVSPAQMPYSRSAEFSGGISGGGTVHSVQQQAPSSYTPSSVLSPIKGTPNGQSPTTYDANRILDYYRS